MALDVGEVDARDPAHALVARRGQAQLEAQVLLVALLVLVAAAGRRAVGGLEGGVIGLRREYYRRIAKNRPAVIERRRKRSIRKSRREGCIAGRRERVQVERVAGAVGEEEVGLVVPGEHRGHVADAHVPVALDREVLVLLLVLRNDVVGVEEAVLVRVLVKGRRAEDRRRLEEGHRGVEVDRAGLDLRVLRLDVDVAAHGVEHQAAGGAGLLEIIDAVVAVEQGVGPLAVGAARIDGEAAPGDVAEQAAGVEVALVGVVVAVAGANLEFGRVARLAGRHDHRAGQGVAPVERALRPLQHLDLRDVVEFLVQRVRVGLQHAVDHQREIRLGVAAGVDAADHDLQVAGLGGLHLRDARRQRDEIRRPLDARRLDLLVSEGLDRDRHVLDLFGALARGDHDFGELGCLGAGVGRGEYGRDGGGQDGRAVREVLHGFLAGGWGGKPYRCIQSGPQDHTLWLKLAAIQGFMLHTVYRPGLNGTRPLYR